MNEPSHSVAAILLCGGSSRRMGRDKSQLIMNGATLAVQTAALLTGVAKLAIEVGPGVSGLPCTLEEPPGEGPLAGIAAGWQALRDRGHEGSALAIACDLPFLSEDLLRFLIEWDSPHSVIPVVGGRPQPLCAKWGRRDLDNSQELVVRGVRSLRHVSEGHETVLLDESAWGHVATERNFSDVDSPEDLRQLGLA